MAGDEAVVFVDAAGAPIGDAEDVIDDGERRRRRYRPRALQCVAWVVAAALAAVSPCVDYVSLRLFGHQGSLFIDGWGREQVRSREILGFHGHEPRLGVVSVAAAILLLLAAAFVVVRRIQAARLVAVAGTAVLAAFVGVLALNLQALSLNGASVRPGFWLAVAAAVAALAGLAPAIIRRPASPKPPTV